MNMNSAMASARAHHRRENFRKAVENTVNKLSSLPDESVRVSTELAKYVLLNYKTLVSNGRTYSTQVKNIGAGVKELYLAEISETPKKKE